MTLAVMTRASLGHTGRELVARAGTQAIYAAVVIAACARVAGSAFPELDVRLAAHRCIWPGSLHLADLPCCMALFCSGKK